VRIYKVFSEYLMSVSNKSKGDIQTRVRKGRPPPWLPQHHVGRCAGEDVSTVYPRIKNPYEHQFIRLQDSNIWNKGTERG